MNFRIRSKLTKHCLLMVLKIDIDISGDLETIMTGIFHQGDTNNMISDTTDHRETKTMMITMDRETVSEILGRMINTNHLINSSNTGLKLTTNNLKI